MSFQVTLDILVQAQALNIPALWLQPGAEDDAAKNYIREAGLESKIVLGGPCVLVSGDDIFRSLL
jgi:predicted CoA-binding protein